jgi:hypothetical protein
MRLHPGWCAAVLLLAGCASLPPDTPAPRAADGAPAATPAAQAADKAAALVQQSGLAQTATQPLNDLNLMQARIPAVLTAAQRGPYAIPFDDNCAALQAELLALDAALGPDIDGGGGHDNDTGLMSRATEFVGDAAMDSVRGTVNSVVDGVIPLRSWVRRLSGAERHSRAVAAAIRAGTLRRPFLKGWAAGQGCLEGPLPVQPGSAR